MLCNVWCLVRCPLVMCSFGKDLDEDMQRIAYILLPCVQLVFCCPDVICILTYLPGVLQYMTEARFNWRMMKTIFTELHVYDEDNVYVPFDFQKEEPFLQFQRKVIPNTYRPS